MENAGKKKVIYYLNMPKLISGYQKGFSMVDSIFS